MASERLNVLPLWREERVIAHLVEEGFDKEQAHHLAYLVKSQYNGKTLGLVLGTAIAVTWKHWYGRIANHIPRLAIKQTQYRYLFQLGIVGASIAFWDFVFTSPRNGANNFLGNYLRWNNNLYQRNKQDLISHFHVLDRKFSQEEIRQFNIKRELMLNPNRRWIFNEYIHDIDSFNKHVHEIKANIPPWEQSSVINVIQRENGDKVELSPFSVKKNIDATGIKYSIKLKPEPGWGSV